MALFETIPYKVIQREGQIEIRAYDDFLLASTKTKMNAKMDSGFNPVFAYISGQNEANAKISMTTPVVTYEEDQTLITGFYVPKKFTKVTAPKPVGGTVFINELKQSYYAVIRFSGDWREKNLRKHEERLRKYLLEREITILSTSLLFRYQPPFVPGLFRRNEIAFKIEYQE